MPKKNLTNLIQQEAQKFTPPTGEPVIEVTAQAVLETQTTITDTPHSPNNKELEAKIEELQQIVATSKQKEANLKNKIKDLQITVTEKEALVERLMLELQETKQTALQLADSNSQLLAEIKVFKQPHPQPNEQATQISKSIQYKKSHRSIERLQEKPTQDSEDFSKNTWLYD
jgi:chromosome segregation ATPase